MEASVDSIDPKEVFVVREYVLPVCAPMMYSITLIIKETDRIKTFSLHAFATCLAVAVT